MHRFLDVRLCYSRPNVRIKSRFVNHQVKVSLFPPQQKDTRWLPLNLRQNSCDQRPLKYDPHDKMQTSGIMVTNIIVRLFSVIFEKWCQPGNTQWLEKKLKYSPNSIMKGKVENSGNYSSVSLLLLIFASSCCSVQVILPKASLNWITRYTCILYPYNTSLGASGKLNSL